MGDRNKIAKNLKFMLKYVIGLKPVFHDESANKIQIYGIHVYRKFIFHQHMAITFIQG